MAYVSVSDISYLLSWSQALKNGGHAPLDKIFPLFAPNLLPTAFLAGPAFFTLCLFVTSTVTLLLSLTYGGAHGCVQGFLAFRHMVLKQKPKLPASSRVTVWPTAPTP
jgi:polyferredoxin